jgi:hypothetical protein
MRMICATFHCAGKYPVSRTALNNWVRYFIPIIGNFLRKVIKSAAGGLYITTSYTAVVIRVTFNPALVTYKSLSQPVTGIALLVTKIAALYFI